MEERVGLRGSVSEIDVDSTLGIVAEGDRSRLPVRRSRDEEVFGSATKADKEVVVIRVDDGCAA